MMGWSLKCYIPSFVKIGLPVLEKKIFSGFYHIVAQQPSWSCDLNFGITLSLPLPRDAPQIFSLIGHAVSGKKIFEKCV